MDRTRTARRIARLTTLAAAGTAAAALALPAAAAAEVPLPPDNGELAWSDTTGSIYTISLQGPAGAEPRQNAGTGVVGQWRNDGGRLAISRTDDPAITSYDLALDTSTYDFSTEQAGADGAAYGPKSTRDEIAFTDFRGLTVKTAGFTRDVATAPRGRIAWGNENRIYYSALGSGLVVYEPYTQATAPLVVDPTAKNPSVSQDASVLAYETTNHGGGSEIYTLDLTDPAAEPQPLPGLSLDDERVPAVSPDGRRVAFARGALGQDIVIVDRATGTQTQVASTGPVNGLAWRPVDAAVAADVSISGTPAIGEQLTLTKDGGNAGSQPRYDEVFWERCTAEPAAGPDAKCTITEPGETSYLVRSTDAGAWLRAVSLAKNGGATDRKFSGAVQVAGGGDTQGPAAPTITFGPEGPISYSGSQFHWTGAEAGGSYECRLTTPNPPDDAIQWDVCTSPVFKSFGDEGTYTFEVRQRDGADNPGAVASRTFTVDRISPVEPKILTSPAKTTTDTTATFTLLNPSAEATTFQCRLDGVPSRKREPVGPKWVTCTSPVVYEGLAVGEHWLDVRQRDAAGNGSDVVRYTWTIEAKPVVEEPKPEQPKPETPAPQIPAPTVEHPPAPAAPGAPQAEQQKPAVTKATPKPPALVATIGGTKTGAQVGANGGTSSAATIQVAKESVGVGCSITGTVLKSCKVDLFADVAGGTTARAAAVKQVLVGTGTYVAKDGSAKVDVEVELNATGRALLRRSPDGLEVSVKITGQPVSGAPLKASGVAKLVTDRASLTVGGFAVNSAVLSPAAKRQLRTLAKFGKAATVRCVGHTDGSSDDAQYLRSLGAERAKAVCAYLAKHGVKAGKRTLVSKADTAPAASNATKAGRAKNRRVVVTLVR